MYSSLETLIYMYLFLILIMMASTISGLKHKTFKKAAFANGTSVCAVDSPSKVVYTGNISVLLPVSSAAKGCMPPSVLCCYECLKDQNCTSYNYDDGENACQLFDYAPINFKISTTCEYHQVLIFTPQSKMRHDFNIKLIL